MNIADIITIIISLGLVYWLLRKATVNVKGRK
jgi:hypothetical protein